MKGLVSITSALHYDAAARAVRLVQPRAERIEMQGLSGQDAERLEQIGAVVAQELLHDQALHTFDAKDLTLGSKVYDASTAAEGELAIAKAGHVVYALDPQWTHQSFWPKAARLTLWWPDLLTHARVTAGGIYRVTWPRTGRLSAI